MKTYNYEHQPCPECNSRVFGRSDKRFCSIECKNRHHNHARKRNKPLRLEIDRQLARNFTILEGLMRENGACMHVHESALVKRGFSFEAITGVSIQNGIIIFRCYHFTYVLGKNGVVRVRCHRQIQNDLPGFFRRWEIDFPDERKKREKERQNAENWKRNNSV